MAPSNNVYTKQNFFQVGIIIVAQIEKLEITSRTQEALLFLVLDCRCHPLSRAEENFLILVTRHHQTRQVEDRFSRNISAIS